MSVDQRCPVIAVGSLKGGAAKTTVAVNLAVAAAHDGRRVLIIDADSQGSSMKWGERRVARPDELPPVAVIRAGSPNLLKPAILSSAGKYDVIIIDTPAQSDIVLSEAIRISDAILVPVRPWAVDLEALVNTVSLVRKQGKNPAVVVVDYSARSPEVIEAIEGIKSVGIILAPVAFAHRVSVPRLVADGAGACDRTVGGILGVGRRVIYDQAAEAARGLWRYFSRLAPGYPREGDVWSADN